MQMEAGLDSGPVILQRETMIGPDETGADLTRRLARLGASALGEALALIESAAARPAPQEHARATLAPKVDRDVARIDWSKPATDVANLIRAFDPVPAAWTTRGPLIFKCFRPRVVDGRGAPGTVLAAEGALRVAAGDGAVEIGEVKPAGKGRMAAPAWLRGGGSVKAGDRLE
jgi:methionyl-tRNA formyltransferase